ncbi:DNA-binding protein HU [Neisseria flavescens NRL30031/H210]|uniref:DNA-binding protein HU n=1 Tax=Neisseria flavescens NRL30031/H210 TaxID=546264 RepID=C0EK55_NEIFL|nr:DNA-binding protein HU [Neisseria flavescens NRL30031/H210]
MLKPRVFGHFIIFYDRKGLIVNKSELIEAIAQEAGISKSAAQKALDATTNAVTNALKNGDTVTLVGFGTFYVGERAERQGRNPKTGEPLTIAAAKTPKFRAGKALKDAL